MISVLMGAFSNLYDPTVFDGLIFYSSTPLLLWLAPAVTLIWTRLREL